MTANSVRDRWGWSRSRRQGRSNLGIATGTTVVTEFWDGF
jgi:hypothetical protein